MSKRLAGVFLVVLLGMLGAGLAPAFAVEEGGAEGPAEQEPLPGADEIGTRNDVSDQFRAEAPEQPSFFGYIVAALTAAGVLAACALLLMYLRYQPRFAAERRAKSRR
jgi:hypothetical protein